MRAKIRVCRLRLLSVLAAIVVITTHHALRTTYRTYFLTRTQAPPPPKCRNSWLPPALGAQSSWMVAAQAQRYNFCTRLHTCTHALTRIRTHPPPTPTSTPTPTCQPLHSPPPPPLHLHPPDLVIHNHLTPTHHQHLLTSFTPNHHQRRPLQVFDGRLVNHPTCIDLPLPQCERHVNSAVCIGQ